jgi:lipoate-protein ligase A
LLPSAAQRRYLRRGWGWASVILWCDGAHDPRENMRRDAALLDAAEDPGRPSEPVLRLFRFEPPGITLGRSQSPTLELDLDRCRRDGVPWALRPTGGRAIFHAQEWTFSLASPIQDRTWGGDLMHAYAAVADLILRSLIRLGVPAAMSDDRYRASPFHDRRGRAAACFASQARHEIVLGDRKLVGIAQRRTAHALLEQGSLLLGPGHLRLVDYLAFASAERSSARARLDATACDAGAYLGSQPALQLWADALAQELPRGTRRVDAAAGASLLTPARSPSYTA